MEGGDPLYETSGYDRAVHPEIRLEAWARQRGHRDALLEDMFAEEGLDQVKDLRRRMVEAYRARNGEELTEDPSQAQPLPWDPNELADARARMARIHERGRQIDPQFNAMRDPDLGPLWASLNEGNLAVSEEQALEGDAGLLGEAAELAAKPLSGIWDAGFALGYGLAELGTRLVNGLSGGRVGEHLLPPTQGVLDENGRLWTNGGKVTMLEFAGALWQTAVGEQVSEEVANLGAIEQMKDAQREGLDSLVHGAAYFVGGASGFMTGATPVIAASQAAIKGLAWLGSLGRGVQTARATQIINQIATWGGASLGTAAYEMAAYGNVDGYGKAFIHGSLTGPIFVGLSRAGLKTEKWFRAKKAPAWFARPVAGALEGVGLTVGEAGVSALIDEAWGFVKHPTANTWAAWVEAMLVNVVGMAALKGLHKTPGEAFAPPGIAAEAAPSRRVVAPPAERAELAVKERTAELEAKELAPRQRPPSERLVTEEELEVLRGRSERFTVERRRTAEKLRELREERRQLQTDPETGVGTPEVFRRARERVDIDPGQEWVQVDIRGLKELNDLVSQEAGDAQIRKVANAIRMAAAEQGISPRNLFRAGGDEFALAVPKGRGEEIGRAITQAVGTEKIGDTQFVTGARHGVGETWAASGEAVKAAKLLEKEPTLRSIKREQEMRERGQKLLAAEERVGAPMESVRPAVEAAQKARQEIKAEVSGVEEFEGRRIQEEREEKAMVVRTSHHLVRDLAKVEPVEGAEPTRAADIVLSLQGFEGDYFRLPFRAKRLGVKWASGWFSANEQLARGEEWRNLAMWSHEWSHGLQANAFDYRWVPKDKAVRSELLQLGSDLYGQHFAQLPLYSKIREGWAEFWARDLFGDPDLQDTAPNAYRELKAWMAGMPQTLQGQYLRNQRLIRNWLDQGSLERVRQSVVMADDPPSEWEKRAAGSPWKRFKRMLDRWTDDLAQVRHAMQKAGVEPGSVPITSDPYRLASIHRMRAKDVAETFLWRATLGETYERTGEGLKQALEGIQRKELRDFVTYLVARRNIELLDKGMVAQLPRNDYLVAIDKLVNPRFEKAARRMKAWSDRLIDYSVQHGALSEDAGQKIKEAWSVYVPFFRAMTGPRQAGKPVRGIAERGTGVERIEGSTLEIRDPMKAMMEVTESIVSKAHLASTMKALHTLMLTRPRIGGLVTEVPRDKRPLVFSVEMVKSALEKLGIDVSDIPPEVAQQAVTLFEQATRPTGGEAIVAHTVRYTEAEIAELGRIYGRKIQQKFMKANGKTLWLELDPDMFEGLMGIDAEQAWKVWKPVSFATHLVKMGATGLDATFTLLTGPFRDAATLPMFSESKHWSRWLPIVGGITEMAMGAKAQMQGKDSLVKIANKLKHGVKVDPVAQMLRDLGGPGVTFLREATLPRTGGYEEMLAATAAERAKLTLTHPLRAAGKLVDVLERGLAEPESFARTNEGKLRYENALKEGKSKKQAVLEGLESYREITQNFIRNGPVVRSLSRAFPYLGAHVGGMRRATRVLMGYDGKQKATRAWTMGVTHLTSLAVLGYLMHGDEDWWNERPAWLKNNYINLKVGGIEITLPKSFELSKLFMNPMEWALGKAFGTNKTSAFDAVADLVMDEIRSFAMLPSIVGPTVETMVGESGWSFFKGREIVPSWMVDALPPEERFQTYTSWIARQIGSVFRISPMKVEHWVSGHTGGLGLSLMRAVDDVFRIGEEARNAPTTTQEELADLPFVGTFFRQAPFRQSVTVEKLYDLERELRQEKKVGPLKAAHEALRLEAGRIKRQIAELHKDVREGKRTREDADRRAFLLARPLMERAERLGR